MKVNKITIKMDRLIIDMPEIRHDDDPFFVIRKRGSKEEFHFSAHVDLDSNRIVLLYQDITLPEAEFSRYDIFVSSNTYNLERPKLDNAKLNLKTVNPDAFHFTTDTTGYRVYLTRDNELSLLRGNYINVEREFKVKRNFDLSVVELDSQYVGLTIRTNLPDEGIKYFLGYQENKERFNVLASAESNVPLTLNYEAIADACGKKGLPLLVAFVKEGVLFVAKLVQSTELTDDTQLANNGIYTYFEKNQLFVTSNLDLYLRKICGIEKQPLMIRDYSISANQVSIELEEALPANDIDIYQEDITNKTFAQVSEFTVENQGKTVVIPMAIPEELNSSYRFVCLAQVAKDVHPQPETAGESFIESDADQFSTPTCAYYGFFSNQPLIPSSQYGRTLALGDDGLLASYFGNTHELTFRGMSQEQFNKTRYEKFDYLFSGSAFIESEGAIKVELENLTIKPKEAINFYLIARRTQEKVLIPHTVEDEHTVTLDFQSFIDDLELSNSRWDMLVEAFQDETMLTGKIGLFSTSVQDKFDRYLKPLNSGDEKGAFKLVPYLSIKNELAFVWNDETNIKSERLSHTIKVVSNRVTKSEIRVGAELSDVEVPSYKVVSGLVKLRNKAVDLAHQVPVKVVSESAGVTKLEISIKPADFEFIPFYWDVFVVIEVAGQNYPVKLANATKTLKRHVNKHISANEINLPNQFMIYPYVTVNNGYALCFRERASYENRFNRLKEIAAYATYRLFKRYFDHKKIWIGYEKEATVAQDNGYQFFNYCYTNNKKKNFYYVIKPDSIDYQDIKHQKDKILNFMSFKYMVYLFASELFVSSESKGHSYDIRIQKGYLQNALKHKPFIFLQHGQIALKRIDSIFDKKRHEGMISRFVTSSENEANIIKNDFGYDDDEVIVTGLARWDKLVNKATPSNRTIFVLPTWRGWMDGVLEDDFIKTDYYEQYQRFLGSQELADLLEESNVKLHFLLHPKFAEYSGLFEKFASDNIIIHHFGELKINEMLMSSSLLVTDYSSASFDYFYMKKPIIFYQFDRTDYMKYQGSYIDLDTELFGDSALNFTQLIEDIHYYVDSDFKEKLEFAKLRGKYFKYVDTNNSQRIYKEVKKFEKTLK
ncbi:teichoic acid biosynthesis protein [Lacticaseibacillus rhamnosus]|uniref:CDP-glycerol glycerophosphotransferase family protein n=1 Tax=Lacticaseibacillus rhamnosus TaxID=47715 RepID=UPI0021A301BA|nr:CDP-glycerol glycerophosphotransferase family protein [Lacticaseibacillus rhamnosus]MCT3192164.1 teichoic acid biosynthesis protein [Lacticaseibacillus rhamnosus]MCT3371250.1 teichoic acid biosynthesis protein [Lacticaseibacillus rhamnosus]